MRRTAGGCRMRRVAGRTARRLQLSRLDKPCDAFYLGVFRIVGGVVGLFQRCAEGPGEDLVDACLHRTYEGVDKLKAGGVALAVDELDEQLALRQCQTCHARRVLLL